MSGVVEGLSAIETVVSAIKLAIEAGQYAYEVCKAQQHLHELGKELMATKGTLEQIKGLYDDQRDTSIPVEQRAAFGIQGFHERVIAGGKQFDDVAKQIAAYFDPKRNPLDIFGRRLAWPHIKKRVQGEIVQVKDFYGDFSMLLQIMTVKNTEKTHETTVEIKKVMERVDGTVSIYQGRQDFEAWVERLPASPPTKDFNELRREHRQRARNSPPSWVLESKACTTWLEADSERSWLWALGDAGTGKTSIASFVADHLQTSIPLDEIAALSLKDASVHAGQDDVSASSKVTLTNDDNPDQIEDAQCDAGLAVFFCDYKQHNSQGVDFIFRCLIRQLILQLRESNPRAAWKHIEKIKGLVGQRSTKQLPMAVDDILADLLSDFPSSFIIIDALDENPKHYETLVDRLYNLKKIGVRIFVTSRAAGDSKYMRAHAVSVHAEILDVNQNAEVIRAYVESTLLQISNREFGYLLDHRNERQRPCGLVDLVADAQDRAMVTKRIIATANGNFLCAKLQIEGLLHAQDEKTVRESLDRLHGNVEELFQEAFDRVKDQSSKDNQKVGQTTLMWSIYAGETLAVSEVLHALRLTFPDFGKPFDTQLLVESTCYFLSLDSKTTKIEVHKAVRDYCDTDDKEQGYFESAHANIARICMKLLKETSGHCRTREDWTKLTAQYPLINYAAQHWGWHLKKDRERTCETKDFIVVKKLLETRKSLDLMAVALQPKLQELGIWDKATWQVLETNGSAQSAPISALHFLAYFDLPETAERWLPKENRDIDRRSRTTRREFPGHTALYLACKMQHSDTVKKLIELGADPALGNDDRKFCLNAAAYAGYVKVVEDLLGDEVDIETQQAMVRQTNFTDRTVLADAATNGDAKILRRILDIMEEMDDGKALLLHQHNDARNALHEACDRNNWEAVAMLLEAEGGNELLTHRTRSWQDTPLHSASHGRPECVEKILKLGGKQADPHSRQREGKTPLHLTVQDPGEGPIRVVPILLPRTSLILQDHDGRNILHGAIDHDQPHHIPAILNGMPKEKKHELLTAKNKRGRSPLVTSIEKPRDSRWREPFKKLMEAIGRDIPHSDAAEMFRHLLDIHAPGKLGLLLENIDDPWVLVPNKGTSVLHEAGRRNNVGLVESVWRRFPDPELLEHHNHVGQTPMLEVAGLGHTAVVKYFLELGADINAQGGGGRTALHWAVELDRGDLADLLLGKGINYKLLDKGGLTALQRASVKSACRQSWRANSAEPKHTTIKRVECISSTRNDERVTTGDEGTRHQVHKYYGDPYERTVASRDDYLITDPLPPNTRIPISAIAISVTAQDQGFSDHLNGHPQDRDTYRGSNTWFDIAIKRGDRHVRRTEFTRNKLNSKDWRTYESTWDLEKGHSDGGTSRWRRPQDIQEAKDFVRAVRPGDQLVLIAKTQWQAWHNRVKCASIKAYYDE